MPYPFHVVGWSIASCEALISWGTASMLLSRCLFVLSEIKEMPRKEKHALSYYQEIQFVYV